MQRVTRPALLWLLLSVSLVTALAVPLNKRGFVSGDQGVKLIMAVEATRHPARPLEIDLPSIGHRPVLFLDRFFVQHRDHAHGLQSPLFPLITAPFLTGFGLSGLYVLPALGFVALWPLLYAWNRQRGSQAPTWALGVVTVAANPMFFYAFEFWEHTAAVALLTASAVIGGGGMTGAVTRPPECWLAWPCCCVPKRFGGRRSGSQWRRELARPSSRAWPWLAARSLAST